MTMESRGILMYIWGKPEYGMMAHQLAMSLKYHSPLIPIHLMTDHVAVSRLRDMRFFDTIEYTHTPSDPAGAKIDLYNKLPFDHTIFLDADGLCVSEMDSVFDQLMKDEKPFRCFVYAHYNQHDPVDMPLMVWARRDVIWDHYNLNGESMPATQSSMLYIRKSELSQEIYRRMAENYAHPIPLDQLKNKWGGGQPDELYLNVTLAQMHYDPSFHNIIYFSDDRTLQPHQIKHQYKLLCLFGTAANVKPQFERFYNSEVAGLARHFGVLVKYEWKNLKASKHANIRTVMNKRQAFKGGFVRSEKLNPHTIGPKKGRTLLFTSYFYTGNGQRQSELHLCLGHNLKNPEIDHVYLWCEDEYLEQHPKLTTQSGSRPTYQTLIDWANSVSEADDIVVIANSDIHFDDTLRWPHLTNMASTMIALSRWDVPVQGKERLFAYEHSQDTWIFRGNITLTGLDYFMGLPGCDNRIAFDAHKAGYRVVNTAKDIITYHHHLSNHRSYTQDDRIIGDYMPVFITSIRDVKVNKLLLQQPGKVGDILICLPIAKHFRDAGYEVFWQCPREYHSLFDYVDYVKPVENSTGDYARIVDISFGLNPQSPSNREWKRRRDRELFVQVKYDMAGVPLYKRYQLEYVRKKEKEEELFHHLGLGAEPYVLFHPSSDYGTPIERPRTDITNVIHFTPYSGFTIFDWRKVIENAAEIHCIDSSLANFVEVLDVKCRKVFYRVPERTTESLFDFNKWELIDMKLQTV